MRLRRLKTELDDFEKDLRPQPPKTRRSALPPKEPIDVMAEVAAMRERLEAIQLPAMDDWRDRISNLRNPPAVSEAVSSSSTNDVPPATLSSIDTRLAVLEKAIGPVNDDELVSPQ